MTLQKLVESGEFLVNLLVLWLDMCGNLSYAVHLLGGKLIVFSPSPNLCQPRSRFATAEHEPQANCIGHYFVAILMDTRCYPNGNIFSLTKHSLRDKCSKDTMQAGVSSQSLNRIVPYCTKMTLVHTSTIAKRQPFPFWTTSFQQQPWSFERIIARKQADSQCPLNQSGSSSWFKVPVNSSYDILILYVLTLWDALVHSAQTWDRHNLFLLVVNNMLWISSSQSNNNTHRRRRNKTHKLCAISKNKKRTLGQHWATSAFFMASFIELLSATPCVDLFSLEWADLQVINDFLPAVLKGTPCGILCMQNYLPPRLLGSPKLVG